MKWVRALLLPILAVICSVVVAVTFIGVSPSGESEAEPAQEEEGASEAEDAAGSQENPKVGEDVVVGDVRWKLISAEDRGGVLKASESEYAYFAEEKTTPGRFVQVEVEVENLGKDMKSATDLSLVDSQGREYTSASDVWAWIPDDKELLLLVNINPNIPQQFISIYEVAAGAEGLKLKVGDLNLFGSDEALIELGF